MMENTPALVPVFWSALAVLGIAGIVFFTSLTFLLGTQRPIILRVVWISASVIITAGTALILILTYR